MIQKIREATALFFGNLGLFSAIVLTVWLPASILLVYLRLYVFPTGGDEFQIAMQEIRVNNVIECMFGPLIAGAIIYAADQLKQGYPATYGEAMAYGAKQSLRLLGARIACGFMVLLGLLAFVIPGIWLALRFALIDPIVVLERRSGADARKRSTDLTQGIKWQILGTSILAVLWIGLIAVIIDLPFSLLGQSENFIFMVISECVMNVLLTILMIVLLLFYWEAK
jgi:hypothetical protein